MKGPGLRDLVGLRWCEVSFGRGVEESFKSAMVPPLHRVLRKTTRAGIGHDHED